MGRTSAAGCGATGVGGGGNRFRRRRGANGRGPHRHYNAAARRPSIICREARGPGSAKKQGACRARPPRKRSRAALVLALAPRADRRVVGVLDAELLLPDGAGDLLGVLHLALADADLLLDHRRLLDADPLLLDRDADLLAL